MLIGYSRNYARRREHQGYESKTTNDVNYTNLEREMAGAAGLFAVSERRIAIELESNESHLSQEPLMKVRLTGILLGTAVGDALGLPAEGLSPRRRRRLMPGPWRHRLVFGRGMMSDDTEHTLFVAQSLLERVCKLADC
jgi:hypothetical protein